MYTRRSLLRTWLRVPLFGFIIHSSFIKFIRTSWAEAKKILPRGIARHQIVGMNPDEVDNRNLDIDPVDQFGTMGPTDVSVDLETFRLKLKGEVDHPLSLSYNQILRYPSSTEAVLLICPGFFAINGRWTGVNLKPLLRDAQVRKTATYIDVKGAYEKVARIPLEDLERKKIFLAYSVNGIVLPQKHGFPLRLVFEGAYGDSWVKYVDEIIVS